MAQLLLVSNDVAAGAERSLPVLALLPHDIHLVGADTQALTESARADLVVLDGRSDLAGARMMARLFQSSGSTVPLLLVLAESGLAAVAADWGISDMVLDTCGPAEFEARIRLLVTAAANDGLISSGGIVIDDAAYSVLLEGEPLDLTYTEFELLKYLVQHPGRVFSRRELVERATGYAFEGYERAVDSHVKNMRHKFGASAPDIIETVVGFGYRLGLDRDA